MNRNIPVISINVLAESELLVADHQSTRTNFRKQPVRDAVYLTPTGFDGDSVTHTDVHGGNHKAVCCYNADHFAYWKERLSLDFKPSAFGENLTLKGPQALETQVCIGDRYHLGEALVEVSEPRGPCYIIGIRYNYKPFPLLIQETGYSGFYLRTIIPGKVAPGDELVQASSHPDRISVQDVNRIRYQDRENRAWLEKLISLEALTPEWRRKFEILLEKAR